MRTGVPQGSMIGPPSFRLFVDDLPGALEAQALLFAHDVKMATPRTQKMNLHSPLIAAWDWFLMLNRT